MEIQASRRLVLFALAAVFVFSGAHRAPAAAEEDLPAGVPAPSTASPPSVEIPMDLKLVLPVIEVRLDGRGPYRMIMDSGAGVPLILDEDLAEELGLETHGTERIGDPLDPHALETGVVRLGSVEVGGLRFEGVKGLAWDRKLHTGPDRPRGVLGLGLFGDRLVTFDYPRRTFRVSPGSLPEPDGVSVLAARWDHIPSIDIEVAGRPFRAHLDTGSTGFLQVPESAKGSLPLAAEPREVGRARTANSDFAVLEAPLEGTVRIGSITLDDPPIRFMPFDHANVGSELLRSAVVTFDRANHRVRLVAEGPVAPPSARFGVRTRTLSGESLAVEDVEPGSTAERSGLRAGDAIVKINGRPVGELAPGDVAAAFRSPAFTLTLLREGREIEIAVSRPECGPS